MDGKTDALALYDRVRAAGYAVGIKPLRAAGGYRYSLRVTQLASQVEAAVLAEKLKVTLGLTAPVVTR
ncbi:MAG: SPOR domain-containing protein [Propionivibrio sp.]|uniref:SPOR domain-containing protein n=1 Tax=Candidatus Propionivibrio dominans TaxID=2954373 RepID=A0A9D7I763_9RHOO|nr:SPOR domain-containing protein [Candidatus Propionivibrio dominans]